jgi:hypothetical protein
MINVYRWKTVSSGAALFATAWAGEAGVPTNQATNNNIASATDSRLSRSHVPADLRHPAAAGNP